MNNINRIKKAKRELKSSKSKLDWIVVESNCEHTDHQKENCTNAYARMPNIKVFSGSSHPDLAARVVDRLGKTV